MCSRHCAGYFIYDISNPFLKIPKVAVIISVVQVRKVKGGLERSGGAELGFEGRIVRQQTSLVVFLLYCVSVLNQAQRGCWGCFQYHVRE